MRWNWGGAPYYWVLGAPEPRTLSTPGRGSSFSSNLGLGWYRVNRYVYCTPRAAPGLKGWQAVCKWRLPLAGGRDPLR
jgi:hypothetical protein